MTENINNEKRKRYHIIKRSDGCNSYSYLVDTADNYNDALEVIRLRYDEPIKIIKGIGYKSLEGFQSGLYQIKLRENEIHIKSVNGCMIGLYHCYEIVIEEMDLVNIKKART